jgi:hypothetical protein
LKNSEGNKPYYTGDHEITFDDEMQRIAVRRDTGKRDFPLSRNIMYFLTRDVTTTFVDGSGGQVHENAKAIYKDIVNFAIGRELEKVKLSRSSRRGELLDRLRKIQKFKDIIPPVNDPEGEGYRSLAQKPILISPNKVEQTRRLLVLLGAKRAGNESATNEAEYNAILDELHRSGQINKRNYKIFYYKYNQRIIKSLP